MKKLASAFALSILLAACSSAPPPKVASDFGAPSKINLDVKTVSLTDRSNATDGVHMQPSVADAIKQWSTDHLQAAGSAGEAIVVIKDASVVQQAIPHEGQWFTREQTSKYNAHVEVELQIKGQGDSYAIASAQASRYETLPENATEAEKQNAYMTVLNGLVRDLGQNLNGSIHEHLQHFVMDSSR
ncbi:MAG TPA: hypothetical protein VFR09_07320 [Alphaproteobacteria bacterium]|nr:hypothetical protein [Alphaproteobacteria bacterium]